MRIHNTTHAPVLRLAAIIALAFLAFASNVKATDPVVKTVTFEFGPGTANAAGSARNFSLPTGRSIKVDVTIKRLGPSSSASDIACVADVFAPSATPPDVGPLRATKQVIG